MVQMHDTYKIMQLGPRRFKVHIEQPALYDTRLYEIRMEQLAEYVGTMEKWCQDNTIKCSVGNTLRPEEGYAYTISFTSDRNVMAFKLRWS